MMPQNDKMTYWPKGEAGLYVHIPFCRHLCHYCDFAKTANYSPTLTAQYFVALKSELTDWLERIESDTPLKFTSVFIGGGTPSLFVQEYENLFQLLTPHLSADCEVTMEVNPEDISTNRLKAWRSLGVNRLSMGVQTFDREGLAFLKRGHTAAASLKALDLIGSVFDNFNCDMIYGWPQQTQKSLDLDLRYLVDSSVPHLSLYTLTYEPRTPIGRAALRNRLTTKADDDVFALYEIMCQLLASHGYDHEEVSNWSKNGFSCRHNWLYWQNKPYVGIGAGAHGFLPDGGIGKRYANPRNERSYIKNPLSPAWDDERDEAAYLLERIATSLRTNKGFLIPEGYLFDKDAAFDAAMAKGAIHLNDQGHIMIAETEWFRENYWILFIESRLQKGLAE